MVKHRKIQLFLFYLNVAWFFLRRIDILHSSGEAKPKQSKKKRKPIECLLQNLSIQQAWQP